jgi:hypothetical protein
MNRDPIDFPLDGREPTVFDRRCVGAFAHHRDVTLVARAGACLSGAPLVLSAPPCGVTMNRPSILARGRGPAVGALCRDTLAEGLAELQPARRARLSTGFASSRCAIALAGALALGMLLLGPATAGARAPTVAVPVVVDGVRQGPNELRRLDDRPLYSHMSRDGRTLVATTRLARFEGFLRRHGMRLPPAGRRPHRLARASGVGHVLRLCTGSTLDGECVEIASGWGVADLRYYDADADELYWDGGWWYHDLDNRFASAQAVGQNALLFDRSNFDPEGGVHAVLANTAQSLGPIGWANRVSSALMHW